MKQASRFDGLSFDPFSLLQDGLAASEVDIGRGEVLQALVIASMVVLIDKGIDLLPEITGQVVVFQQDAVLQGAGYTLYAPFTDYLCRRLVGGLRRDRKHISRRFCRLSFVLRRSYLPRYL